MNRVSRVEKFTLLLGALATVFLYVFAKIAEEVHEGATRDFDRFLLLAFRSKTDLLEPLGPVWLAEVMRDITALGSFTVLGLVTFSVAGFLMLTRKRHAAGIVVLSITSGTLVSSLLKWLFARPRPDLVPHATVVYTQSFPSGHAMLSAVVYLTLGALLARTQAEPRVKAYLLLLAIALTLTVGISRVYLGVHWPTDVLAGWAVGACWALLWWVITIWLQSKGTVEPPSKSIAMPADTPSGDALK
ncbi:MAG: phosphatase PAP2 family protein [Thiobacillus sp.]